MKVMSRRLRPYTVTVYNLTGTTSGVATYQRTVLKFVSLDTGYNKRLMDKGFKTEGMASLIIDLRDFTATSDRTFLPYKEWLQQTDKTGYFTFGTAQDFFIKGTITSTLPTETKQTMAVKYELYSVSSVSIDNTNENKNTIVSVVGK